MSTLFVNTIKPDSGSNILISSSLTVSESLKVAGDFELSGSIKLGNADTDSIGFVADVSSSILPDANETFDLGSTTKKWRHLHAVGITASGDISSSGIIIGNVGQFNELEFGAFTNITASVISCSGTIIADAFQSAGEDDQLDFSDHINITGNVTASGNIKANGYTGTTGENLALTSGRVLKITHAEGYDVEIGGTNDDDVLKVEGNASAQKVTFGSTTHGLIINSNITSSGNISSSGGNITANFPDTNDNADHYVIVTTGTDATLEVQNSLSVNPSTNTVTMGNLISDKRQISIPASATDGLTGNGADVIYFGSTTSMTTGAIYHFKSDGTWELADADAASTSDGLLGVALGATSDTDGVLLKGMVNLDHDPGTVGDVLYLSTTAGDCSATAPSGNGDIVRIIGYCLHATAGRIWFDPDKTFVEVNA